MDEKLQRLVREAGQDESAFENLIQLNKNFILSTAYRTVHRYVTESDDEWSIALIAFHEAVCGYDHSRGDFRAYAAMVMRSRLLDYVMREDRHRAEIAAEPEYMDGTLEDQEEVTPLQLQLARKNFELSEKVEIPGGNPLRDEIDAVTQVLDRYEICFMDLTECSPHAEKTKVACAKPIRVLITHPELMKRMRERRLLPIREICEVSGAPRKICERHRKYIIAVAEILTGEFPMLAEYLRYVNLK